MPNEQHKELNFDVALTFLKDGYRICRAGWNGKGMWLKLVEPEHLRELRGLLQ